MPSSNIIAFTLCSSPSPKCKIQDNSNYWVYIIARAVIMMMCICGIALSLVVASTGAAPFCSLRFLKRDCKKTRPHLRLNWFIQWLTLTPSLSGKNAQQEGEENNSHKKLRNFSSERAFPGDCLFIPSAALCAAAWKGLNPWIQPPSTHLALFREALCSGVGAFRNTPSKDSFCVIVCVCACHPFPENYQRPL